MVEVRLSDNFLRKEFRCHCGCGRDTVDAELLFVLQRLRSHYGQEIKITSGYRCYDHNRAVHGANDSKHLLGKAADIKVNGISQRDVYDILNEWYPVFYGIGIYSSWVHIDVRSDMARWDSR